jgi:hypothetical protein
MIICILMVPLSVFFHDAYSCRPYIISNVVSTDIKTDPQSHIHYQGGFLGWKAWLRTLNPAETMRAIVFAFSMAAEYHQYGPPQAGYLNNQEQYDLVGYQQGGGRHNRHSPGRY